VIDERARQDLFTGLDEALGPERAETLMAHLPLVGWADVATRQDLAALGAQLRLEWRAEIRAEINAAIATQTRIILFALLGTLATMSGFMLAVIQLTR
jgi:hypothetical protein